MLTKTEIVDRIETLENGCVQVRTATRIMDGDTLVAQSFHRHVVTPGQDYSGEDGRVQAICEAVHTPECIAEYRASISGV